MPGTGPPLPIRNGDPMTTPMTTRMTAPRLGRLIADGDAEAVRAAVLGG